MSVSPSPTEAAPPPSGRMSRFTRWWIGSLLVIGLGWHLSPDLGNHLRGNPEAVRAARSATADDAPRPLDEMDLLRVRRVDLTIDEDRFDFLFSRPPLSLNSFQETLAAFDGRRKGVRGTFRIRGGHSWHWHREKPSFRLRFSARRNVWNRETLDFINPEDAPMQANLLADFLALRLGIPAAVTRFAEVSLNHRLLGLYHFTDRLDDRFLERIGRPRQPIAEGNRRRAEMWRDPQLWDIHSSQPAPAEACRKALAALLDSIRPPVAAAGIHGLGKQIDLPALASWSALLTVIGSLQADDLHNQDLIFDPGSGRFRPLIVDSTGFGALTNHGLAFTDVDNRIWLNEFLTPITNAAFRNPTFLAARNRAIATFLAGEAEPGRVASLAHRLFAILRPLLAVEPHRGALVNLPHLEFPMRLPTSIETVASSVTAMTSWYASRSVWLRGRLDEASVIVRPIATGPDAGPRLFWIEVFGHAPLDIPLGTVSTHLRLDDDRNGVISPDSPRSPETLRLHPGLREGIPPDQPWLRLESRLLPFALLPASQGYLLGIEPEAWEACRSRLETETRNALTGGSVAVVFAEETSTVPAYPETAGLHPWSLGPEAIVP